MQRRNHDAQKIANYFALITISLISVSMMIYVKFGPGSVKKTSSIKVGKIKPLECLKNNYGFDKITDAKLLKQLFVLYQKKEIKIFGSEINNSNKKVKTKILNQNKIKKIFLKTLKISKITKKAIYLAIYYEIIQAKQKNSLDFVGVLKTSFRFNGQEAYRIFTNLKNYSKKEIQEKILCSLRSFENNAK